MSREDDINASAPTTYPKTHDFVPPVDAPNFEYRAPQAASERAAWVRERAAMRGMTPQAYAEYVAALRKDYAIVPRVT